MVMMNEVWLQITDNDSRIYDYQFKSWINESIYGKKYSIIELIDEVCCIHAHFIKSLYPSIMLWWFIEYQVTLIMMCYDRAGKYLAWEGLNL